MSRILEISSQFDQSNGIFENGIICLWPQITLSKLDQFQHVGGVLESSEQAEFKTVTGFAFW